MKGDDLREPSWQSHLVHRLVSARMRPHAFKEIDPIWVRSNMGRPRRLRRLLARTTGAASKLLAPVAGWPGGEVVTPPHLSSHAPVVLYLHGGGFIACSPETHRILIGSLAMRLGATVFAPAYRLAPEHAFPAALDDAIAAYRFILSERQVPAHELIIAGDSAGGGLALSLAMSLRDRGLPQPAAIFTFSPWADLATTGASLDENSDSCSMFAGVTIRRAAAFYLGGHDPHDPRVSPLYGDFAGLAPLLIHASVDEVLRDDSVRVAERARADGVPVEFRLWKRVPHVWQFFGAILPEARESLDDVTRFVNTHLQTARERVEHALPELSAPSV